MSNVFIKPATIVINGQAVPSIVPDPVTRVPLAASGEYKPLTPYWRDRLRDGDVVEAAKVAESSAPFGAHLPYGLAKNSRILSQRFHSFATDPYQSSGMASVSGALTFFNNFTMPAHFDLVRLVYGNDRSTPYTIDAVSVAPSATWDGLPGIGGSLGYIPVDGAGLEVPFQQAFGNNAGANVFFDAQANGSTKTLVVPAGSAGVPSYAATDWVAVSSIDRTDGEQLPLLFTRTFYSHTHGDTMAIPASKIGKFSDHASGWNFLPLINRGHKLRSLYAPFATDTTLLTKANLISGGAAAPKEGAVEGYIDWIAPMAVQFYSRGRGFTVMAVGDSHEEGYTSTADQNTYGFQACAMISTPARPVSFVNSGWPGERGADILARGKKEIDLFRPNVVMLEPFTGNDFQSSIAPGVTDPGFAAIEAKFASQVALAEYAERSGAVVIWRTNAPLSFNAVTDGYRRTINDRIRAMGAAGMALVFDLDAVVSDGGTPARILNTVDRPYLASDSLHMTDAAYTAGALALVPTLRQALSL